MISRIRTEELLLWLVGVERSVDKPSEAAELVQFSTPAVCGNAKDAAMNCRSHSRAIHRAKVIHKLCNDSYTSFAHRDQPLTICHLRSNRANRLIANVVVRHVGKRSESVRGSLLIGSVECAEKAKPRKTTTYFGGSVGGKFRLAAMPVATRRRSTFRSIQYLDPPVASASTRRASGSSRTESIRAGSSRNVVLGTHQRVDESARGPDEPTRCQPRYRQQRRRTA